MSSVTYVVSILKIGPEFAPDCYLVGRRYTVPGRLAPVDKMEHLGKCTTLRDASNIVDELNRLDDIIKNKGAL